LIERYLFFEVTYDNVEIGRFEKESALRRFIEINGKKKLSFKMSNDSFAFLKMLVLLVP